VKYKQWGKKPKTNPNKPELQEVLNVYELRFEMLKKYYIVLNIRTPPHSGAGNQV